MKTLLLTHCIDEAESGVMKTNTGADAVVLAAMHGNDRLRQPQLQQLGQVHQR
jgi:hypothetical protein